MAEYFTDPVGPPTIIWLAISAGIARNLQRTAHKLAMTQKQLSIFHLHCPELDQLHANNIQHDCQDVLCCLMQCIELCSEYGWSEVRNELRQALGDLLRLESNLAQAGNQYVRYIEVVDSLKDRLDAPLNLLDSLQAPPTPGLHPFYRAP